MVSGKTVLTVVLVISLILNLFLILRTSGLSSEKDNYAKMGEQAVLLVKASGIGCRAEASEPLAMEKCLKSMNTKYATEPFEEKGYKNYDEKNEEQGYLIVQNRAMREFGAWDCLRQLKRVKPR